MSNTTLRLAAATFALAASAGAWADNVNFPGFAHGSETVTINLSNPDTPISEGVYAGGFSTVLNGGPSFTSYCVDVYQTINFGAAPYPEYTPVGSSHAFANSNAYADLSKLFATAGVISDAVHEAAFQIAVWEIAYETSGTYDLSHGSASFTGGTADSSGALTLASNWLAALGNNGAGPGISVLDSSAHQDLIYAPIPEPSTVVLMAMGLLGIAVVAKRRAASAGGAPFRGVHTIA